MAILAFTLRRIRGPGTIPAPGSGRRARRRPRVPPISAGEAERFPSPAQRAARPVRRQAAPRRALDRVAGDFAFDGQVRRGERPGSVPRPAGRVPGRPPGPGAPPSVRMRSSGGVAPMSRLTSRQDGQQTQATPRILLSRRNVRAHRSNAGAAGGLAGTPGAGYSPPCEIRRPQAEATWRIVRCSDRPHD